MNNMKYIIYRANKSKTGSATQFQYNEEKNMFFLVSSKQTDIDEKGNARFAWTDPKQSVTVKMGLIDLGEFLAVLDRIKPKVGEGKGLFHENAKGTTIIHLEIVTKDGRSAYAYKVSSKRDGPAVQIQHMISVGEAEILKTFLRSASLKMLVEPSRKKEKV